MAAHPLSTTVRTISAHWRRFSRGQKRLIVIWAVVGVLLIAGISSVSAAKSVPPMLYPPVEVEKLNTNSQTTYAEITETRPIKYSLVSKLDEFIPIGTSEVTTDGRDGVAADIYKVTYVNGEEVKRVLIKTETIEPAIDEITSIGVYIDPNENKDRF